MNKSKVPNKMQILGLDYVVRELEMALNQATFIGPEPEYAGMVRNDIMKEMTKYLQEAQYRFKFDRNYEIKYNAGDIRDSEVYNGV